MHDAWYVCRTLAWPIVVCRTASPNADNVIENEKGWHDKPVIVLIRIREERKMYIRSIIRHNNSVSIVPSSECVIVIAALCAGRSRSHARLRRRFKIWTERKSRIELKANACDGIDFSLFPPSPVGFRLLPAVRVFHFLWGNRAFISR